MRPSVGGAGTLLLAGLTLVAGWFGHWVLLGVAAVLTVAGVVWFILSVRHERVLRGGVVASSRLFENRRRLAAQGNSGTKTVLTGVQRPTVVYHEVVRLQDTNNHAAIANVKFVECTILGPGTIVVRGRTRWHTTNMIGAHGGDPNVIYAELPDEAPVPEGAVLITDSTFEKCTLDSVTIMSNAETVAEMKSWHRPTEVAPSHRARIRYRPRWAQPTRAGIAPSALTSCSRARRCQGWTSFCPEEEAQPVA